MKETSIVPSLLLVAFIVLKLCGIIAWSWWWVMAPLWIPAAAAVCIFAAMLMFHPDSPSIRSLLGLKASRRKIQQLKDKYPSKWQQRLNEMEQKRNQDALDKMIRENKCP